MKKTGIELINEERKRQLESEGYDSLNDSFYKNNELPKAAACYAAYNYLDKKEEMLDLDSYTVYDVPELFPFDKKHWKPSPNDRIKELSKAGALIAAEIDRIQAIEEI